MAKNYAKLSDGNLELFKNPLVVGDTMHFNPSEELLISNGWKEYKSESIDFSKEKSFDIKQKYVESDTAITRTYEYEFNPQKTEKFYIDSIQEYMDMKAQELGYDHINSACTYINTGVVKFDAEGDAFRQWRSAVWNYGYAVLAQALAGEIEIPTLEEFVASLPELVIKYPEELPEDDFPTDEPFEEEFEKKPEDDSDLIIKEQL